MVNREMMRLVASEVPNTGMAVSIDTGDAIALHPKNKKPIGLRHAYLALKQVYSKDIVDNGPRFKEQTIEGNQIIFLGMSSHDYWSQAFSLKNLYHPTRLHLQPARQAKVQMGLLPSSSY